MAQAQLQQTDHHLCSKVQRMRSSKKASEKVKVENNGSSLNAPSKGSQQVFKYIPQPTSPSLDSHRPRTARSRPSQCQYGDQPAHSAEVQRLRAQSRQDGESRGARSLFVFGGGRRSGFDFEY